MVWVRKKRARTSFARLGVDRLVDTDPEQSDRHVMSLAPDSQISQIWLFGSTFRDRILDVKV